MLNTLMDISEAESGTMQLHREPVALADVVARRRRAVRDVADDKGRRRSTRGRAGGDRRGRRPIATRLEQVARQPASTTPSSTRRAGGRVDVDVAPRRATRAILRVRDTGIGIPADELPRIWDRLFRGDTSRAERGLGLGLSLVKAIVEAHGGTVEVESEPGQGSTFTVSLPARA